jgi:HEPN domain-containing protein
MPGKTVVGPLWFAENSMIAGESLDADNPRLTGEITFHAQQAVEKYLKAFILVKKLPLKRIHNLIALNETVKQIKDFQFDETMLQILTGLYSEGRYSESLVLDPNGALPSVEQAKTFLAFARTVAAAITAEIGPSS